MPMEVNAKIGDVVIATAGRDEGKYFLVVGEENGKVLITDGKTRKVKTPKTKSQKHIKIILSDADKPLAERISQGQPVSNEKVKKVVDGVKKIKIGGKVCV